MSTQHSRIKTKTGSHDHSASTSSPDIWNAFHFHTKDELKGTETVVYIGLSSSAPCWKDKLLKLSKSAYRETESACFHSNSFFIWPLPSRLSKQFYCRSERERERVMNGPTILKRTDSPAFSGPVHSTSSAWVQSLRCIETVMWILRRM